MAEHRRDVVALAVMTNRMEGIVRKMTNTLFRTARSTVLNTARDFSCCVISANHELLVMGESLPIHVISGPDLISRWLVRMHPQLRRGDAFLHNSPYHGNSHAGDHCIVVPVIDDDGVHRATAFVKAHMADIGNSEPTTMTATARDVYEEGALIFPCVKVQQDYRDIEDVIRMCQTRIRVPEDWYGDYLGMIGAGRVGERELLKIGEEVGWDAFDAYVADWLDYSEERMRATIRSLPAGRLTGHDIHDAVPLRGVEDGVQMEVTVAVDPQAGEIEIDLRNNPDCLPCGLNLTESTSQTSALIGVFNSIDNTLPRNTGSARAVNIRLRENCCLGIPVHPGELLAGDLRAGRAPRRDRAADDGRVQGRDGHGLDRARVPAGGRGPVRARPSARQRAVRGHDDPRQLRRRGARPRRRLADQRRDQRRRLDDARQHRGARAAAPDSGVGRSHRPRHGGRRALPRRAVAVHRVRPRRHRARGPVHGRRHGQPGARRARRRVGGAVAPDDAHRRGRGRSELEAWGRVVLKPGETIISISSGGGGYGPAYERDPEHVLPRRRRRLDQRRASACGLRRRAGRADGSVDERRDRGAARRAGRWGVAASRRARTRC
jgi:N-methylhydantoinase B